MFLTLLMYSTSDVIPLCAGISIQSHGPMALANGARDEDAACFGDQQRASQSSTARCRCPPNSVSKDSLLL